MLESLPLVATTVVAFLLAGFVKGMIGLGLPTVGIGLLSLVMPPVQAVALLVVPTIITNIWQLFAGPRFWPLLVRLWLMVIGISIGTWFAAGFLTSDSSGRISIFLGLALATYAVLGLTAVRFSVPARAEQWLSPVIGLAAGFIGGLTGVFSIPGVPYLQALNLNREDLIQALGLMFTACSVALGASLAYHGAMHVSIAGASILGVGAAFIGMFAGQWVRMRVRENVFRTYFFIGMLVLGTHLASRGFL